MCETPHSLQLKLQLAIISTSDFLNWNLQTLFSTYKYRCYPCELILTRLKLPSPCVQFLPLFLAFIDTH